MKLIDILTEENTLLIVPNEEKKSLLHELENTSKLYSLKIMSLEEFMKHYKFSYDEKTIAYCYENHNISYDIILEYLNILPYLEDKTYKSSKLNFLVSLKHELIENNLLIIDKLFLSYLNKSKIIVYDYQEIDPFYKKIFSKYNTTYLYNSVPKKELTVYEAEDIDSEISYVLSKISKLILAGTPISHIHLLNVTSEYITPLSRLSKWYKLPIIIPDEKVLWNIPVAKKVYELLTLNKTTDEIIELLDSSNIDSNYYDTIIDTINKYLFLNENYSKRTSFLKEVWKHTEVTKKETLEGIDCRSLTKINDDDYYFLLGMNQENIPKIDKGEKILNDSLCEELGLFSSNDKNKLEKIKIKEYLYSINNLVISYKKKTPFQDFNPSLLIEEDNMNVEKIEVDYNSSLLYNQVAFIKSLDYFNRYGKKDASMTKLYDYNLYKLYRSYKNQFTGIDTNKLSSYLQNKLLLSYSSLDNYYRCSFRYYLSNILKVDKFEETFYTSVGSLFHSILSKAFEPNFNFELEYKQELKKYSFGRKELFLLTKLKQELELDISIIKDQLDLTSFTNSLYENKFYLPVPINNKINVTMMGIIDKVWYYIENNITHAAIIDYKTGTLPDKLNYMIYGIGMQLPIYYYLLNHSKRFTSIKITGIFLQKIIDGDKANNSNDESSLEEKKKNLKLVGYATSNEYELEKLDSTYQNSELIKSMKMGTNGFYKYSKVLNDTEFSNMDKLVDTKIKEAAISITNGNFKINPKRIGKENIGCSFCSYKDICFLKEEDIVDLEEHKDLDFLRGDTNA